MTLLRHLTSFLSFTFITVNLLFWLPLLLLALIIRLLLPIDWIGFWTVRMIDSVYRMAVKIDAWWFKYILGIQFVIEDEDNVLGRLSKTDSPLIISNHRSWFDVFILQTLISSQGPVLKFLIKTELLWVPVLGWICLALNFPRLKRKGDLSSRRRDLQVARSASIQLGTTPGALILFPEGTRFTEPKRVHTRSCYRSLLNPKPGGFNVIYGALPESTMVIDISIRYLPGEDNCWRCMSGLVDVVHLKVTGSHAADLGDHLAWLDGCWSKKDQWLNS